jgi:hypothetical protein
MRYYFLLGAFCLTFWSYGQDSLKLENNFFSLDLHHFLGASNNPTGYQMNYGLNFRFLAPASDHFKAGISIGYEQLERFRFLPLALTMELNLAPEQVAAPIIAFDAGYGIGKAEEEENEFITLEESGGGWRFAPKFGVLFPGKVSTCIFLGFVLQESFIEDTSNWAIREQFRTFKRTTLGIGVRF